MSSHRPSGMGTHRACSGNAAYNASKAAVKSITEGLSHELRNSPSGNVTAHLFVYVPAQRTRRPARRCTVLTLARQPRVDVHRHDARHPGREARRRVDRAGDRALHGASRPRSAPCLVPARARAD